MQGEQAMSERGRGSDEACKLTYTVVKRLNTVHNGITVLAHITATVDIQ